MSVTKLGIIRKVEEHLNQMYKGDEVPIIDGAIVLSIQIKNGHIVQTTKEREFVAEAHK